jgi:flagellar motor component MotA
MKKNSVKVVIGLMVALGVVVGSSLIQQHVFIASQNHHNELLAIGPGTKGTGTGDIK